MSKQIRRTLLPEHQEVLAKIVISECRRYHARLLSGDKFVEDFIRIVQFVFLFEHYREKVWKGSNAFVTSAVSVTTR